MNLIPGKIYIQKDPNESKVHLFFHNRDIPGLPYEIGLEYCGYEVEKEYYDKLLSRSEKNISLLFLDKVVMQHLVYKKFLHRKDFVYICASQMLLFPIAFEMV